jgi:peptidoglycan/xylan/chitin deacetylase (PgdA/CDA1 family)
MSAWLDPLRAALDATPGTVTFFFRDDDAGWRDDRLRRLLEVFDRREMPIDLAVIPCALGRTLARELGGRRLHQHGYAHVNHEPSGRSCEFGPARAEPAQRADIESGRRRLEALLETTVDPIFTPPWNRCTPETGRALLACGLRILSRESRAPALGVRRLAELPVHIDWFARRKGTRLTRAELGHAIAREALGGGPVGIMLHHAVMDGDERGAVAELLEVVAGRARVSPMLELAWPLTSLRPPPSRDAGPALRHASRAPARG